MLKEKRRQQLLNCAGEVFSQKGYYAANISDIIDRAGVARGTFYLYFEGKWQIFDNIINTMLGEIERCLKPIQLTPGSLPPLDQLRDTVNRVFAYLLQNKNLIQILLHHAEGLDKESDEKLAKFYQRLADMIESGIKHGIEMGLIRQRNPRLAAYCIIGLGKEGIGQLIASREAGSDLDELLEEFLSFGLLGILLTVPPHYRWINGGDN